MSFPNYGELPMNIKHPAGDFGTVGDIKIEFDKDYLYLSMDNEKYKLFVEPTIDVEEIDIEKIADPDYEVGPDDLKFNGYGVDWNSIEAESGKSVSLEQKHKILTVVESYFSSLGYPIVIDNKD